jgi:MFS family permease
LITQKPLASDNEKKTRFFYGYIIVLVAALIMLILGGSQYSFGVFFKPVLNDFGWTRAVTAGAYSMNLILTGIFSVIAGRLVGKLGPRIILTACGVFVGLGYLLMSSVASEWQYYLYYGVITSIGLGCMTVPLLSTVARWFNKGRGLASGIVLSGVGVGIVVMPQIANAIITKYNWRTSFLILGIIALVLIVILAQFMKRAPDQKRPLVQEKQKPSTIQPQGLSVTEATHTRTFWIFCMTSILMGFVGQVVMVHMVAHATDIGFAAAAAATILSVVGFVSIFGKIFMGSMSDRIGNRNVMILFYSLYVIAFIWIRFAGDLWMLYLFAVIFAAGYSGAAASHSPQVAEFFGLRAHGTIFGISALLFNAGGALGSFLAGYIFDATGGYLLAFLICTIISLTGVILSSFLPAHKKVPSGVRAKISA